MGTLKNSLLVYLHTLDSSAYSHLPVLLHVLFHLYPARFVEREQYWRSQWVFLDQSTPLNPISFHSGYFSSRDTLPKHRLSYPIAVEQWISGAQLMVYHLV